MKIAFIGIGKVGFALANSLQKVGHQIIVASDDQDSESVKNAMNKNSQFLGIPPQPAIEKSEIVFLATPYMVNESVLSKVNLDNKILVDCTNPIGPNLTHGLKGVKSGSEITQELVPNAKVIKAFTIYGFENFQNSLYPGYGDIKPAMLIAGNDSNAKSVVNKLCIQLGWDPVDTGGIENSLHLEHMTLLWIKMARIQGKGADFVWSMLQR